MKKYIISLLIAFIIGVLLIPISGVAFAIEPISENDDVLEESSWAEEFEQNQTSQRKKY